jgi:hypothetical protein
MLLLLHILALLSGPALALTPPVGWSAQGLNRALLDPADPLKGELREIQIPGKNVQAKDLVTALGQAGLTIDRFGTDPDGATNLVLSDRLGRARSRTVGANTMWWVVLVGHDHAKSLDPDALLHAVAPPPETLSWGQREAIQGGSDGSPWGEVAQAPQEASGWIAQVKVQAWTQDPAVVGVWEGQSGNRARPAKLRFRFETTGLLQVQRIDQSGEKVLQGRWATRGSLIQMDITGGGANLPYHVTDRTLSVPWHGNSVSLYKQ